MTRGPAPYPISDEQLATAKKMLGRKMSYRYIANRIGVPYDSLRGRLDPEYLQRRRARREAERKELYTGLPKRPQVRNGNEEARNPRYDPLRDGPPRYREPFSQLMGDPPVGRSALDAMNLSPRKGPSLPSMIDRPFGMPAD